MKILVADDDSFSRRMLEAALRRWGYDVLSAGDGIEALKTLESVDPPRFVILDWMMPGMDGPEICRRLRQQSREPYVYVILLTARDQKEDLIEGLEAGADDYLSKPFNPHELKVRVRAGMRIVELQAELIAAREELRNRAMHDSLTNLLNRSAILESLEIEIARAQRQSTPLSLLLIDLDHFKSINDRYGHAAGDEVLRQASRRMQTLVRPFDVVGRYGGEEFLLLFPECNEAQIAGIAERLRAGLANEAIEIDRLPLVITCSIGAVTNRPESSASPDSLIEAADEALYRAKCSGRDRVEIAPPIHPETDAAGA